MKQRYRRKVSQPSPETPPDPFQLYPYQRHLLRELMGPINGPKASKVIYAPRTTGLQTLLTTLELLVIAAGRQGPRPEGTHIEAPSESTSTP